MASQESGIQFFKNALASQGLCRPCNHIDGPVERMDQCFSYLTQLYFFNQKEFRYLLKKSSPLLKKPSNEMGWALRGYFAYLIEDYKEAAASFLEAIALAPQNLDNWLDYAFTLRHLECHKASLKIIFNTKEVMRKVLAGPMETRKMRLIRNLKI